MRVATITIDQMAGDDDGEVALVATMHFDDVSIGDVLTTVVLSMAQDMVSTHDVELSNCVEHLLDAVREAIDERVVGVERGSTHGPH